MADDKAMHVKMVFVHVQNGEWYKAIEEYKKILALDPYDPHVYNMMGDAYARKKDDKESFEAYLKSRELYDKLGNLEKVASVERKIAKLSTSNLETKTSHPFMST